MEKRTPGKIRPELFYHTFSDSTSTHTHEIEFLLAKQHKICPVEVKSSGYMRHASLDRFCRKYRDRISESYVICTKDYHVNGTIKYVPIYMTQFL